MSKTTITYSLNPGRGFAEIGFRVEQRKGQNVLLIRQASSWVMLPIETWECLADAIDDKLEEYAQPELGKLYRSPVTPAKFVGK